jgi:hypothetical protein
LDVRLKMIIENRPAYLRWKCIDDFTNMNKKKLFHRGNYSASNTTSEVLKSIFSSIKQRYTKQIIDAFSDDKSHVKMAGGGYTFFFVLPKLLKFASCKYPFLPIELVLEEIRSVKELKLIDCDFVVGGYYIGNESPFSGLAHTQYFVTRRYFDDAIFLSTSKKSLEEFGSRENLLNNQDIVFGRLDEDGEKKYLYSFNPSGRENESPKVVIDSYFMAHLLMMHGVGIWHTFSSAHSSEKKNFLIFEDEGALAVARRFVFYRNQVKHLDYFKRKVFKFLEESN